MRQIAYIIAAASIAAQIHGEEGMWTFDQLPKEKISKNYGVKLSEDKIDQMRLSALRLHRGSASFVSSNGLILTNHHVAHDMISHLSSEENDYIMKGFYARTQDEEIKCPNLHADQLIEIRDVTADVNRSLSDSLSLQEREKAKKEVLNELKEKLQAESGYHVQVVQLYRGAKMHLYVYKRYTDVRLVMAPDLTLASFGGDEMNFEYPRMCFDFTFLRAYENGKPVHSPHHLTWNCEGPKVDEPLFVIGNPGSTERIFTADHLKMMRDHTMPLYLQYFASKIDLLKKYSEQSDEHARQAESHLKSFMNGQKVYRGQYKGLVELPIIANKQLEEDKLLYQLNSEQRKAWQDVATNLNTSKKLVDDYRCLEKLALRFSMTYKYASTLARFSQEVDKPSSKRFPEFVDSERGTIERTLQSEAPIYSELEIAHIQAGIDHIKEQFGDDHPLVLAIERGPSVKEMVERSEIGSSDFRMDLFENPDKVVGSRDPMLVFARLINQYSTPLRHQVEDEHEAVIKQSYAKIAQILMEKYGNEIYPDATFSLRMSFGRLKGYTSEGEWLHPVSQVSQLFDIYHNKKGLGPYALSDQWVARESELKKNVPINYVTTTDTTGGNSGSPMVNAQGEIVGILFDGNREGLVSDFAYDDTAGRSISVHTGGIMFCIKEMYGADRLVEELKQR